MRFTLCCAAAVIFDTTNDKAITTERIIPHVSFTPPNVTRNNLIKAANAAVLTIVLIKAVITVGEPS